MAQNTSTSSKNPKAKTLKQLRQANVLESLKDIGGGAAKQGGDLLRDTSSEFLKQLLGTRMQARKFQGEIAPGEEMAMEKVFSGQREKEEKLAKQLAFERRLHQEEIELIQMRGNELKMKLNAVIQEVQTMAVATPKLAEELQVAAIQAPVNPGVYHIFFFEKLLEFIQAFRKKVENASVWLQSVNKRAQKKSFWGMYKSKHGGASFLLSQEHYSQRSAG